MDDEEDMDARSSTDTPGDSRYIINLIFFYFLHSIPPYTFDLCCHFIDQVRCQYQCLKTIRVMLCTFHPSFSKTLASKQGKKDSTLYRCQMGCKAKFDKHGKKKLLSVPDKSVYNCRRHIKVSNRLPYICTNIKLCA